MNLCNIEIKNKTNEVISCFSMPGSPRFGQKI